MQLCLHCIISSSTTCPPPFFPACKLHIPSFQPPFLHSSYLFPSILLLDSFTTVIQSTFCPTSPSWVPFLTLFFPQLCIQHLLVVFIWHLQRMNIGKKHQKVKGHKNSHKDFWSASTSLCYLVAGWGRTVFFIVLLMLLEFYFKNISFSQFTIFSTSHWRNTKGVKLFLPSWLLAFYNPKVQN